MTQEENKKDSNIFISIVLLLFCAFIVISIPFFLYYGWPVTLYLLIALVIFLISLGLSEDMGEKNNHLSAMVFNSISISMLPVCVGISIVALIQCAYYIGLFSNNPDNYLYLQDKLSEIRILIDENLDEFDLIIIALSLFIFSIFFKMPWLGQLYGRFTSSFSFLTLSLLAVTSFAIVGTQYVEGLEKSWRWPPLKELSFALELKEESRSKLAALAWIQNRFERMDLEDRAVLEGALKPPSNIENSSKSATKAQRIYIRYLAEIVAETARHTPEKKTKLSRMQTQSAEFRRASPWELEAKLSKESLGNLRDRAHNVKSEANRLNLSRMAAAELVVNSAKVLMPSASNNVLVKLVAEIGNSLVSKAIVESEIRSIRNYEHARKWVADNIKRAGVTAKAGLRWPLNLKRYYGADGYERLKAEMSKRFAKDQIEAKRWAEREARMLRDYIRRLQSGRMGGTRTPRPGPRIIVPSDERLKRQIRLLKVLPGNIKLYSYKYRGLEGAYVGVLAQQLLEETNYANHVYLMENGFYGVHYDGLNLHLERMKFK